MGHILTIGIGVLVSVLAVCFIAYMAARGWHNGIVYSLMGILVFVVAFSTANKLAQSFSPQFTKAIEPMITGMVDDASLIAIGERARTEKNDEGEEIQLPIVVPEEYDGSVYSATLLSFREIGFDEGTSKRFAEEMAQQHYEVNAAMRNKITAKTASVIAYVLVFVLICVILLCAGFAVINLFNLIVRFPKFDFISRILGAAASVFLGALILYFACWLLRFMGALLPADIYNSEVLAFFFKNNPLTQITLY